MMNILIIIVAFFIAFASAFPMGWVRRIAENTHFDDFDNYLPKTGDLPKYEYSTFSDFKRQDKEILFKNHSKVVKSSKNATNSNETQVVSTIINKNLTEETPKMFDDVADFVREGAEAGMELYQDMKKLMLTTKVSRELSTLPSTTINLVEITTTKSNLTELNSINTKISEEIATTEFFNETGTIPYRKELDPIFEKNTTGLNDTAIRPARQEDDEENSNESAGGDGEKRQESSEEDGDDDDDDEEEEENMLIGLISAFLGGLSRPDGGVDVEAIVNLLASLSTQNDDGSYDFSGLTEILMSLFGGDADEGGSNFGAFIGGLLGAFLQGVAKPPGPEGVGVFTGNILTGILPALSGPPPSDDGTTQQNPGSAGFFTGLLQTLLGGGTTGGIGTLLASSSGSSSGSGGQGGGVGGGSKFSIFKAIFSMISSIFTSSSGSH